jgi:serine O-acetyltransferase
VKIYQGVTLGALSVSKDMKDAKDILQWANVCIYANATILGNTVIGKTVLLVEIHGLQNHSGRFACQTTTTEVKIKELR